MPTVKLQAGKVILKNGKVSCTCCGSCCFYPASKFDAAAPTAVWAGLPESLSDTSSNCTVEAWEKNGQQWENGSQRIIWRDGKWVLQSTGDGFVDIKDSECLTDILEEQSICGWPPCVRLTGPDGLDIQLTGGGCFWETCADSDDPMWQLRFNGQMFELVKIEGETETIYESDGDTEDFPFPNGGYDSNEYQIALLPIETDCCPSVDCCMYPADTPAGDLPDAITLNGTSLSKSGTSYGDTTDGLIQESGVWARYVDGVRSTQTCLITGDGNYTPGNDAVEDTFADTYTLKIDGAIGGFVQGSCENFSRPDDVVLIRTSLCVWRADNVEINVFGGGDGPEDPCNDGFTITITAILSFTGVGWEVAFGGLAGPKNSDENQNTPVGWYGDFMEIVE
jgi:hypothetical protein